MIINEFTKNMLDKFFQKIKTTWKIEYNFLIVEWKKNLWKKTYLTKLISELLWNYIKTDFLLLKDYSIQIWKKHSIKIDNTKKESILEIEWVWQFVDLWAREIIEWLNKSWVSGFKIVLLENIDRMTKDAANALLKTFEETHKKNLIIWTIENKSQIIETVISRAFLIKFIEPKFEESVDQLCKYFPLISKKDIELINIFSLNKIWFAKKILENWLFLNYETQINYENILENFKKLVSNSSNKKNISINQNFKILNQISKNWLLNFYIEWLIYYHNLMKNFQEIKTLLETKRFLERNISTDNVIMKLVMNY